VQDTTAKQSSGVAIGLTAYKAGRRDVDHFLRLAALIPQIGGLKQKRRLLYFRQVPDAEGLIDWYAWWRCTTTGSDIVIIARWWVIMSSHSMLLSM
jgi:hypothetical protein